jgi:hypothetical protein
MVRRDLIADGWRRARRRRRRYVLGGLIVLAAAAALVFGVAHNGARRPTSRTHSAEAIRLHRKAIVRRELAAAQEALAARRQNHAIATRLHRVTEQQRPR